MAASDRFATTGPRSATLETKKLLSSDSVRVANSLDLNDDSMLHQLADTSVGLEDRRLSRLQVADL